MENITLSSNLSQEIFNGTQLFARKLSRPQQFNFRELVRGILLSGSTYLSCIGRTNGVTNNERKTVERLSKTLAKIPTETFANTHVQSQVNHFRNEAVLILSDGGDFQKPYAKKMKKVCSTADGSNGHKIGKGYPIHCLMALGVESGDLSPLALRVYSTFDETFIGEWDEHKKNFDMLKPFIKNSSYDRIIVEDRGCDDEKRFLYFLDNLEASFVTRLHTGARARKFVIQKKNGDLETMKVSDLSEKLRSEAGCKRTWRNTKIKKDLTSKIAFQKVYLPDHLDIPLYAIFCYSEGYSEPLVILTDLETSDFAKAWKYFFYYKKRWEVENLYRAIKQQFAAESFLILDFEKIKALTFLVMLTYSLLLKIKRKLKMFLGFMYEVFMDFCSRKQKTGKHHLDVLTFIRDQFAQPEAADLYRFYSRQFKKFLICSTKFQLNLFDLRKKW